MRLQARSEELYKKAEEEDDDDDDDDAGWTLRQGSLTGLRQAAVSIVHCLQNGLQVAGLRLHTSSQHTFAGRLSSSHPFEVIFSWPGPCSECAEPPRALSACIAWTDVHLWGFMVHLSSRARAALTELAVVS